MSRAVTAAWLMASPAAASTRPCRTPVAAGLSAQRQPPLIYERRSPALFIWSALSVPSCVSGCGCALDGSLGARKWCSAADHRACEVRGPAARVAGSGSSGSPGKPGSGGRQVRGSGGGPATWRQPVYGALPVYLAGKRRGGRPMAVPWLSPV